MLCSRNEVAALALKVARSSGFTHGVAHDLGRAAAWLTAQGADGISAAMATSVASAGPATTLDALTHLIDGSAGSHGPSLVDLLVSGALDSTRCTNLDSPLLLIGLCGVASTDFDCRFIITPANPTSPTADPIVIEVNRSLAIGSALLTELDLADFMLTCAAEPNRPEQEPSTTELVVDDRVWAAATTIAAKTYVPATEASRLSGAGAGLTDND